MKSQPKKRKVDIMSVFSVRIVSPKIYGRSVLHFTRIIQYHCWTFSKLYLLIFMAEIY